MKSLRYWIAAALALAAMPWTSHAARADSQPQIQTPEQQEEQAEEAQQQQQNQGNGGG